MTKIKINSSFQIKVNWFTIVDMKVQDFYIFILFLFLVGCSSENPDDPFEPYNRAVFSFNDTLDHYIAEPVAKGYSAVVGPDGRMMITNFFNNLSEPLRAFNDLLQFKFGKAFNDMERMAYNSTFGFLGFFDFADEATHIPLRQQDMGMTFAYYTNNAQTPYFMIPFIGPSNIRDTLGDITTLVITSNENYEEGEYGSQDTVSSSINRYSILNAVNKRANALKYEQLIQLQLDPYIAMKHAYENWRNQLFNELNS